MAYFKEKHTVKLRELVVNICFKYVDDTFVTLNVINKEDEILNYLNVQHPISSSRLRKKRKSAYHFLILE